MLTARESDEKPLLTGDMVSFACLKPSSHGARNTPKPVAAVKATFPPLSRTSSDATSPGSSTKALRVVSRNWSVKVTVLNSFALPSTF